MGRLKKEVAQARTEFLGEWLELARITEEEIENFRRILESPDIHVNQEFVDRYINTATKTAELYRQVHKCLVKREDRTAMDKAFEAIMYQENVLDKYADFFNPFRRDDLLEQYANEILDPSGI